MALRIVPARIGDMPLVPFVETHVLRTNREAFAMRK
jgi:hypothetical protein